MFGIMLLNVKLILIILLLMKTTIFLIVKNVFIFRKKTFFIIIMKNRTLIIEILRFYCYFREIEVIHWNRIIIFHIEKIIFVTLFWRKWTRFLYYIKLFQNTILGFPRDRFFLLEKIWNILKRAWFNYDRILFNVNKKNFKIIINTENYKFFTL